MDVARGARLLKSLESSLSVVLETRGFIRTSDSVSRGEVFRRWERRTNWRLDTFELWNHETDPGALDTQVDVKVLLADGKVVLVDGAPVAWVVAKRAARLLEGLLAERTGASDESLVRRAVEECEAGLAWLDIFGTPAKCLEQLDRRDRNGVRVGAPLHAKAVELLQGLVGVG
jgi:hypothetical protein